MLSPDKLVTRVKAMCDCSIYKLLLKDFYVLCKINIYRTNLVLAMNSTTTDEPGIVLGLRGKSKHGTVNGIPMETSDQASSMSPKSMLTIMAIV